MDEPGENGKLIEEVKKFIKVAEPNINLSAETEAIEFDWASKWLKGNEYHYILTHADLYIKTFRFGKYPSKTHPLETYNSPVSKILC